MLFVSCGTLPMYRWYGYEDVAVKYTRAPSEESLEALLVKYERIINGQSNTIRQVPPPGIYADYGYFLIQAGRNAEGMEMLEKEASLYPESEVLVEKIRRLVTK